jgi:hypothetical protein
MYMHVQPAAQPESVVPPAAELSMPPRAQSPCLSAQPARAFFEVELRSLAEDRFKSP